MFKPILATKLYIPPPRPNIVTRPRLIERLNEGLRQNQGFGRKLTLISAPAGFGKTTLVSEWVADGMRPVAWLSLDEGDNVVTRFLIYLVAALRTVAPHLGEGVLGALQSSQPPSPESVLTTLLNEITTGPDISGSDSENFPEQGYILVLDDYHVIEAEPVDSSTDVDASTSVDDALTFLLEHLPPQMHLVIATREDPPLPLARYRVQGQLTELRANDLRFTFSEAAGFFNREMGLNLSADDIAALETRTEGWIAGLQLAALALQGMMSMQEHQDTTDFIKTFSGSHHFVLDYLVEEVLQQQPESVQVFLLSTSILDRLCGPLCDAVVGRLESRDWSLKGDDRVTENLQLPISNLQSQKILEYLERANLFIVPLDNERHWYRYHHLFAGFLRQRLLHSAGSGEGGVVELHRRASRWYEDKGLEIEAFHHAVAANDIERAARLVEGKGIPLHFRGAVIPVLNWLESLPAAVLDARPALWVMYASALSMAGQLTAVEPKLQAAEAALHDAEPNDKTRNLIGHIAAIRALLAANQYQAETIITQSRRALEYLHPNNLAVRTATTWKMGWAYQLQGDRAAASRAYSEAISAGQKSGNNIITVSATTGLGNIQEADNQLPLAAQTYRHVLQLIGEPPLPGACEAHLGLARISYQWNDLEAAQQHGQQSVELARQIENNDRFIACEVFLARLKLAQGDVAGAAAILDGADQSVRQQNFVYQMPELAATQVLVLLRQDNLAAAADLAETHELTLSRARVYLAQGDTARALALLEPLRQQVEARRWADERLKVMVLQTVALHAHSENDKAMQVLGDVLALAEPGGFFRIFIDEGAPIAELLRRVKDEGGKLCPELVEGRKTYIDKLLAAFGNQNDVHPFGSAQDMPSSLVKQDAVSQPLPEPLSQRELEVLHLIVKGFSNREISEQLFLALSTVKGHNRNIYGKLQVQRRTEAVARARQLGLIEI